MSILQRFANMIPVRKGRKEIVESSVRVLDGAGFRGGKHQPFDYHRAILADASWIGAAIRIRAHAVASQPLRLYVRKRNRRGAKCVWEHRPVPAWKRRYITGQHPSLMPSHAVVGKAMDLGEDFVEVTGDHPVKMLLAQMNPWLNGYNSTYLRTMWQDLTGNSYFHPVIGPQGYPVELWPMPPQWVEIVPSRERFIEGYNYGAELGEVIRFDPDEVIHFKRPNPGGCYDEGGLFYGKGNVERAWDVIRLNWATHNMDISMFENMARPDFAVIVKGGAGQDSIERFQRRLDEMLRGTRRSGRPFVFSQDVQIQPLNWNPKDMGGREEIVEEIAAVMGVPVTMLKASDPNLASARTAFAAWRETEILPLLRMDEEVLNQSLLPLFGIEDDAVLAYDNPVPDDAAESLREDQGLSAIGARTINEIRLRRGDEPIKGGDEPLVPAGMMRLRDALRGPQFTLPTLPDRQPTRTPEPVTPEEKLPSGSQAANVREIVAQVERRELPRDSGLGQLEVLYNMTPEQAERVMGSAGLTPPEPEPAPEPDEPDEPSTGPKSPQLEGPSMPSLSLRSIWTARVAKQGVPSEDAGSADDTARTGEPEDLIREYEAEVRGIIESARDELDRRLETADPADAEAIAESISEKMARDIEDATTRRLEAIADRGMRFGAGEAEELGLSVDLPSDLAANVARDAALDLAGEIQQTTLDRLRRIIGDAIERGTTMTDLRDEIRELDSVFGPSRAEAIARTESAFAWSEAHERSWEPIKDLVSKEWLLAPRACEFCAAASEQFNAEQRDVGAVVFEKGVEIIGGVTGRRMTLDYRDVKGPPLHPQCRCRLITRRRT